MQAKKASEAAANSLNNPNTLDLQRIPNPETVDWRNVLEQTLSSNYNNLPLNFATGNKVNEFNTNQFLKGANKIQPYFNQLQDQIGRNALSYSRGELPGDVVSSLSRGAASQGFKNGIAGGARGGGFNTALGGLNLRNLGLNSLDLSKFGTGVGMQVNQNAAGMVPRLYDPMSQMASPQLGIGSAFQNAGIINDWNRANTQIANAEETGNTELLNAIMEEQTNLRLGGRLAQAKSIQSASSSLAGIASGLGGASGGGGGGAFAGSSGGGRVGAQNQYLV